MLKLIANLNEKNRLAFDLGIILLASILVTLPILIDGIPDSQDVPQQFQFAQSFYRALVNGEYYPSLASTPNYGYGDVSVRFYPPLAYFVLSFLRFLSGNWYDATLLFFISMYFLSGLGLYLWARESFPSRSAVVGAVVYIFLPYHVMQVYIGAVYSEFTAVALLPFCLLFIDRVCRKGGLIDIAGLAFFYGLLTFTHLPTILTSSLAFLVFALFSLKKETLWSSLAKLAAGVGFGLLLSSFYWVRMIPEMGFLKHNGDLYVSGIYAYKNQFVLSYIFQFWSAYAGPSNLMNVIGVLTLGILIAFSILYWTTAREDQPHSIRNVAAMTVFALFMAVPLSAWLWELIPVLQKIQFPFRWLTLFSVGTAFIAAAGFGAAVKYYHTPKRYLSTLAIGAFLICFPYMYFKMMSPILTYPKDYLNRIVEANFGRMPSYECWWTVWTPVDKEATSGMPRPRLLPAKVVLNDRNHEVTAWTTTQKSFRIEAGDAGQAQIAAIYYPHWKALVNETPVEVTPTATGMISLPLPAGASDVRIYFQEPPRVVAFYYVSGLLWLILLGFLGFQFAQRYKRPGKSIDHVQ